MDATGDARVVIVTDSRNRDQTIREVGEFGLIELLRGALPEAVVTAPQLDLGIGDDAAVWRHTGNESLVVTTDSLVEGVHFRLEPGWSDWASLGHKALAVNLSDLAAMGAQPVLVTVSLGLRGEERVNDLAAAYGALGALAERAGALVAGGDIVASPNAVVWHVTAIGETRNARVLSRSGARVGDVIVISGTIGASAAGLSLLLMDVDDPRRRAATAETLIAAHLRPEPRLALGALLLDHGASAAMDLSDGLYGDLPKLLAASGVAAKVNLGEFPVAAAVRALFPKDWPRLATEGGEDYELLFTISPDRFAALQTAAAEINATVTAIGEITTKHDGQPALTVRNLDGQMSEMAVGAFDHFRE